MVDLELTVRVAPGAMTNDAVAIDDAGDAGDTSVSGVVSSAPRPHPWTVPQSETTNSEVGAESKKPGPQRRKCENAKRAALLRASQPCPSQVTQDDPFSFFRRVWRSSPLYTLFDGQKNDIAPDLPGAPWYHKTGEETYHRSRDCCGENAVENIGTSPGGGNWCKRCSPFGLSQRLHQRVTSRLACLLVIVETPRGYKVLHEVRKDGSEFPFESFYYANGFRNMDQAYEALFDNYVYTLGYERTKFLMSGLTLEPTFYARICVDSIESEIPAVWVRRIREADLMKFTWNSNVRLRCIDCLKCSVARVLVDLYVEMLGEKLGSV